MDVIRFQPGETLTEILDSTASTEQVRNKIEGQQSYDSTPLTGATVMIMHLALIIYRHTYGKQARPSASDSLFLSASRHKTGRRCSTSCQINQLSANWNLKK